MIVTSFTSIAPADTVTLENVVRGLKEVWDDHVTPLPTTFSEIIPGSVGPLDLNIDKYHKWLIY